MKQIDFDLAVKYKNLFSKLTFICEVSGFGSAETKQKVMNTLKPGWLDMQKLSKP